MSKGVLIFAYNSKLDYVSIATVAAKLVRKHLDLPVTLVTNAQVDDSVFDQIIIQENTGTAYDRVFNFSSGREKVQWHNQNRSNAYELSPYDQTLLLDADYLVFDSSLKKLFDTNLEFACYDNVSDISGQQDLQLGARVGNPGIPMQWATVVYFTKNLLAASIFKFMQSIKKNYLYYASAYNFGAELFRNDYTLSIALQALTGYNTSNFSAIPGKLLTANTLTEIQEARPNGEIVLTWHNEQRLQVTKIINTSIHVMNKKSITDPVILSQLTELAQ